jgi:hypothetical protein
MKLSNYDEKYNLIFYLMFICTIFFVVLTVGLLEYLSSANKILKRNKIIIKFIKSKNCQGKTWK